MQLIQGYLLIAGLMCSVSFLVALAYFWNEAANSRFGTGATDIMDVVVLGVLVPILAGLVWPIALMVAFVYGSSKLFGHLARQRRERLNPPEKPKRKPQ